MRSVNRFSGTGSVFGCITPDVSVLSRSLVAFVGVSAFAQDPRALVLESANRAGIDQELQRNYTFRERVEERRFDGAGAVKSTEIKTFDVINLYGRPYQRLIEKNGVPLEPDEEAKEQHKIDRELVKRSKESEKDRQSRLAKDAKELEQERSFRREIADAFLFTMLDGETIGGFDCYVIQAVPKPGFRPRTSDGRALPKVKGKLWISRSDRRWIKVHAETIDTISIGWFLLRVAKGTHFDFETVRVGGEVWMPRHVNVRGEARLAGVKKINLELDVNWSDFHKFSTDSRVVDSPAQ
jgi:hypothetical protein